MATTSLSSALSITQAVAPPRACFNDFPLGHTAGKPHDQELQRSLVAEAFTMIEEATRPEIRQLDHRWSSSDDWKDGVMVVSDDRNADDRTERHAEPQYQLIEDQELAAREPACPTCIFPESAS